MNKLLLLTAMVLQSTFALAEESVKCTFSTETEKGYFNKQIYAGDFKTNEAIILKRDGSVFVINEETAKTVKMDDFIGETMFEANVQQDYIVMSLGAITSNQEIKANSFISNKYDRPMIISNSPNLFIICSLKVENK